MVAQPLSWEEDREHKRQVLYRAIEMLDNQPPPVTPDWDAKYTEELSRFEKYVMDNTRDETRRTLPKTNERDRNQPNPANIIGRHFGIIKRHGHAGK